VITPSLRVFTLPPLRDTTSLLLSMSNLPFPPPPPPPPPPVAATGEAAPAETPPASVKKQHLRWNGVLRIALLQAYSRYMKKEIPHEQIRAEFIAKMNLSAETVPQHSRLMNVVSGLKKQCIEAADFYQDMDRMNRTPTEAERSKELLSGKRTQLFAIYTELGVDKDGTMQHQILSLGNELKMERNLSESKKSLDKQTTALKAKEDNLFTNIMENREYAKRVRQERRKSPSRENEEDEDDESAAAGDSPRDSDWANRRPRSSFSSSAVAVSFEATKNSVFEAMKGHNDAVQTQLSEIKKAHETMMQQLLTQQQVQSQLLLMISKNMTPRKEGE